MRKQEHRMRTAFVKSTDASLVKSEKYGFSNRAVPGSLLSEMSYSNRSALSRSIC